MRRALCLEACVFDRLFSSHPSLSRAVQTHVSGDLRAGQSCIVVHIDRSSGRCQSPADIAAFLAPYQGAEILPARRALWGGYSLVDAELRGMARLLEMGPELDPFHQPQRPGLSAEIARLHPKPS
jgi:hypothetical protein